MPARGGAVELFIRLETDGSLQTPFEVWRADALIEHTAQTQLTLGFYFAFLAAMVIYNGFLYAVVQDRSYLYYVIYLGGMLLFQMTLEGHAGLYLWPAWPAWNDVAAVSLLSVTLAGGLMFVREMANTSAYAPRLSRLMLGLASLALLPIPGVWVSYTAALAATLVTALVGLLLFPWPIVIALRRGYRPAWFLVLGYVALLPGGLLLVLHYLEILESGIGIRHALQMGTAAEAMLLSFALADRIKLLREQRDSAQSTALMARQQALSQQEMFSRRLLEAQDMERQRVALELHDGLGQGLAAIANRLARLRKNSDSLLMTEIEDLTGLATDTLVDVRNLAHTLHPHHLDRLGLSAALQAIAEHMQGTDCPRLTIDIDDIGNIGQEASLHLYRIAQEALNNAWRHANAEHVNIRLKMEGSSIRLEVGDDGRGFELQSRYDGLGLTGIRERARAMDALLTIESGDDGTLIRVLVATVDAS